MTPRIVCILILISLVSQFSLGQDSSPLFHEIIAGDSVMMFFNKEYKFIEKKCADFVRYTRIDSDGNFTGYFKDLSHDGELLTFGSYDHGKKHGYFETHHPNGKVRSKGNYINNRPAGIWEYFYETGLPERTINITKADTLLVRFVDKDGNIKVDGGKGNFEGFVDGGTGRESLIIARGEIDEGLPNGKWHSTIGNNRTTYCKEEFYYGELIRGVFPNAGASVKSYTKKSFLRTFFLSTYLGSLEEYPIAKCAKDENPANNNNLSPNKSFNFQNFYSLLRQKINSTLEHEINSGNSLDYANDNALTIKFSVDDKGKVHDFTLLTGWGRQFYPTIISSIEHQAFFRPNIEAMYFHLVFHAMGGGYYNYNIQLSNSRTYSQ
jgi:hypothetical protein